MEAKIEKISTFCTNFGKRLKKLRKNKGLSQADFAKKLNYKQNTSVSNIEKGKTSPDIETLHKIAETLNADLHWLITGQDSPRSDELADLFIEATERFAPYLTSHLTDLLNKKRERQSNLKALKAIENPTPQEKADIKKNTDDLTKLLDFIKETLVMLNWIQDPFGKDKTTESRIERTIKEFSKP